MSPRMIDAACAMGLLVLLCSVYGLGAKPQLQRVAQLRAQEIALREQLGLSTQVTVGLDQMQTDVSHIEERLAAFEQQLPEDEHLDRFLRQLGQIAERTGLRVKLIKPGPLHAKPLYSQLPIAITAESPFPAFYDFLSALAEMPRLTKVEALNITRQDTGDLCDIELTVLIYVAKAIGES